MDKQLIIFFVAFIIFLGFVYYYFRGRRQAFELDFRTLFILGIALIPIGVGTGSNVYIIIGIAIMIFGVSKKETWGSIPGWDTMPKSEKIMKVILISALLGVTIFGIVTYLLQPKEDEEKVITSYDECVEAGYPIMESYPEQCRTKEGDSFTRDIGNEYEVAEFIHIDYPRPGAEIESPLVITGQARGEWFFEGDFPLVLMDSEGSIVAEGYATAQDEWMTEEFVSFKGILEFSVPEGLSEWRLILQKDNPSDISENDNSLEVPVILKKDLVVIQEPEQKPSEQSSQPPEEKPVVAQESSPVCNDSEDYGDIYTFGTVEFCRNGVDCIEQKDYCVDATSLREFSCSIDKSLKSVVLNCEDGCNSGKCIKKPEVPVQSLNVDHQLVVDSRSEIIRYGFSEPFFDKNFSLQFATDDINGPGGAYVIWNFEYGEFKTTVNDYIGYRRHNDGSLTYIHAIAMSLSVTEPPFTDFTSVVTKQYAQEKMNACLGEYQDASAILNLLGPERGFFYTAYSAKEPYACPSDEFSDAACIANMGIIDLQTGNVLQCDSV